MGRVRGTFKVEALQFQSTLVAVSGDTGAAGTLEGYCPFDNQWFDLPALPHRLTFVAAAASHAHLYVSGGMDNDRGQCTSTVWALDSLDGTWEVSAIMPQARYAHASVIHRGHLWIVGGQIADGDMAIPTGTCVALDLATRAWLPDTADMQRKRVWPRLLICAGSLYAIGGDICDKNCSMLPSLQRYNDERRQWEAPLYFPQQRRVFAVTTVGAKIVVYGGRGESFEELLDWVAFDCAAGVWEEPGGSLPRESFVGGTCVTIQCAPCG